MINKFRFAAATAVISGLVVLHGCGSDSSPLSVVTDTGGTNGDQSSGGQSDSGQSDGGNSTDGQSGTDGSGTTDTSGGQDSGNQNTGDATDNGSGDNGAGSDTDGNAVDTDSSDTTVNAEYEAVYRATFNATWSASTHPINFPAADPHFSPLTGAVHSEQAVFWERGQNATDGIELMAETGGTSILLDEVQLVIDEGRALASITGGGIQLSPGSTSVEFTVNRDYPLVTLVSMLAPSPDWFIGVSSVSMLDANGDFEQSVTRSLNLYDSGTDGGTRFDSADQDVPRSPIALVESFPTDTDFQNGRPPVGELTIERIN